MKTCVSLSWTQLKPPLLPHASGFFHSTGVGCIFHALNLHWSSILYMVMHLFQCYVLKSSHPWTLPLNLIVCSLYGDVGSRHIAYWVHITYCILSAALSTASSFRIWNSSTGILSLPGASVRSSTHDKGHEEGGSAYTKAGSSLRSPPGNSRTSTPKNQSLPTFCFVLSPTPLTLRGAVPHYLFLKKELTYSPS